MTQNWQHITWPELRGKLVAGAPLSNLTWLKVGGPADWLFEPADIADLQAFLKAAPADMPIQVIGAGSNLLVRDSGLDGAVIRLTGALAEISHEGEVLTAFAGAHDGEVARYGARHGLGGLSFMVGIPGTVGGGLSMNAGAYGAEFKDVLIEATAVTRDGEIVVRTPEDMKMRYRATSAPADWIFVRARFKTSPAPSEELRAEMKAIIAQRGDSQPVGARTGGSTFANPEGHKAWQLIDAAGCRGLRVGGAMMSDKHCNFMINDAQASAADLENLGETVRRKVKETADIELRWEIRRIGRG